MEEENHGIQGKTLRTRRRPNNNLTGCKINFFFSDSHLAPKFFKVVANSKKIGGHFQDKQNLFLHSQHSR